MKLGTGMEAAGVFLMVLIASSADNLAWVELLYGTIIGTVIILAGNVICLLAAYIKERRRKHCKKHLREAV